MPLTPQEIERRQARLARRARLVRWAKWLLPGSVLLAIVVLLLLGRERVEPLEVFTPDELARLGAGLRLENPELAGRTERGQPYSLTARVAVPDGAMAEEVTLEDPRGWIETAERRVDAAAARAYLDRRARRLELSGDVEIESSDGWQGRTERVLVQLDERRAIGPEPVRATGPQGWIEAGSFRVEQPAGGEGEPTIWFENGVHLMFTPPRDDEAAPQ